MGGSSDGSWNTVLPDVPVLLDMDRCIGQSLTANRNENRNWLFDPVDSPTDKSWLQSLDQTSRSVNVMSFNMVMTTPLDIDPTISFLVQPMFNTSVPTDCISEVSNRSYSFLGIEFTDVAGSQERDDPDEEQRLNMNSIHHDLSSQPPLNLMETGTYLSSMLDMPQIGGVHRARMVLGAHLIPTPSILASSAIVLLGLRQRRRTPICS